jgi:hypothetical protein
MLFADIGLQATTAANKLLSPAEASAAAGLLSLAASVTNVPFYAGSAMIFCRVDLPNRLGADSIWTAGGA